MTPDIRRPDAETATAVADLIASIERADGPPPLSDRALARLRSEAVTHLVVADDATVSGYGQFDGAELELVARPDAAGEILDAVVGRADGAVRVWSHGRRSGLIGVFEARGLRRVRELWQLRRPGDVPVPPAAPLADGVSLRTFVPGRDEQAWLAVNAAAFASHPEQGRVTLADLQGLMAEDWFDPTGFFLAERDDELLGFHWTKVHPDHGGEVYVLGVSPKAQGLGLGRTLLHHGLRHLGHVGCPYVLLYVDADNEAAFRLYESESFTRHDVDIQWETP